MVRPPTTRASARAKRGSSRGSSATGNLHQRSNTTPTKYRYNI